MSDPSRRRPRRSPTAVERRAARAEIDDPSLVLEAALRFLEARQRSAAEVRRRLLLNGYRQDLVEGAIQRLTELAMLDDAAFARAWVESRDRARPRGERALRRELAVKGVERQVVDEVIEQRDADAAAGDADAPSPDEQAARRLLARHARSLERVVDSRARKQRAYALLARNGFDSELAGDLVRELDSGPLST